MKYLVKIDELKNKSDFLIDRLKVIEEKIDYLENVKNDFTWEGIAKDSMLIKLNEYIKNLKKIANQLLNIIIFFKSYHSNYSEEYFRLKTKYSNYLLNEVHYGNNKI